MVTKGPFMEFLEGLVTTTGANAEVLEIVTPVSRTEKMAMLIHQIQINMEPPDFQLASESRVIGAVIGRSFAGEVNTEWDLDQPEVLHRVEHNVSEGLVVGAMGYSPKIGESIKYFNPPVLYAKASIYLHACDIASGVKNVATKIGYTIDKVSESDFISALVE